MAYPDNYGAATAAFVAAAEAAGATIERHAHPAARAPDDAPLDIVVAALGERHAPRMLLSISGTHGLEACSGSAAQTRFLEGRPAFPAGTGALIVHCLNPYGFAWRSRANEDFVDLSRNFIADWSAPPANPYYGEIHPLLTAAEWQDNTEERLYQAIAQLTTAHGPREALTGLTGGQYDHPDGLSFGGDGTSWSRRVFEDVCGRWLSHARRIAYVDFHTGFGAFGQPFFVCLHPEGSAERDRVESWWGPMNRNADAFGIGAEPDWQGLLWDGLRRWILPDAEICGSVIEFGTYPLPRVARALMIDRWLRFGQEDAGWRDALRAEMVEAFAPPAADWRTAVTTRGCAVLDAALTGLARWQPAA
ncbi:DUF2817 domain-containing protein [Sphingomonas flavalba]|uniref:DUF2817 domain-containing protein n=1 Tax=Sphingomonas flavalba TaxID=2559804 RepID=UPI0039E18B8F